ncbi:MAG: cation-transporting P-type ATPase, partial [Chloroflexi bacterium]|nr:cation-transporting P-type ATPase [Chloroflexota bacterium]
MILQENGRKTARQLWALPPDEVYRILDTPADGLSQEEAAARLESYGPNELPEPPRRSLVLRFADHLTHFMAVLLWVAGILAFVSHTPELGWAIWGVIWINAAFSFWQEYQAERALTALKQSLPEHARVYREGKVEVIPARELVPGDLYLLEEGDRVSADARLVAAETLYLDVSVLTGESMPVSRDSQVVDDPGLRPVEAHNIVLAGASLTGGHGLAIVYATGAQTEFGRVAHLTATVERATSTLEIQVARIVRIITAIAVSMGVLVFLIGYLAIGMAVGVSFVFAIGII